MATTVRVGDGREIAAAITATARTVVSHPRYSTSASGLPRSPMLGRPCSLARAVLGR